MKFALVAHQLTETNVALAARGWPGARSHLQPPIRLKSPTDTLELFSKRAF